MTGGPPAFAAAASSTRRPCSFVTPGFTPPKMRTALRCWKRFSVRGRGARLDVREGRDRHELAVGVLILRSSSGSDGRAVLVADLRNHLVAAIEIVEAVDVARRRAACRAPGPRRPDRAQDRRDARDRARRAPRADRFSGRYRRTRTCRSAIRRRATAPTVSSICSSRHVALQDQLHVVLTRRRAAAGPDAGTRAGPALATQRQRPRRTSARSSASAHASPLRRVRRTRPMAVVSDQVNSVSGKDRNGIARSARCWRFVAATRGVGRCFEEEADVALVLDRREFLSREQIERPGGDHDQQRPRPRCPSASSNAPSSSRAYRAAHQRRTPDSPAAVIRPSLP